MRHVQSEWKRSSRFTYKTEHEGKLAAFDAMINAAKRAPWDARG